MEVIAESVGGDDEEDLIAFAVAFVDAPVAGLNAVGFELILEGLDVGDLDGGAGLAGISAGDCEVDLGAVSLHDYGGRIVAAPGLGQFEVGAVVHRGRVEVGDRQGEDIVLVRAGGVECGLV